jgi:hypothetical protein
MKVDIGTQKVYDDNTKRDQFTFNRGIIIRF